MLGAKKAAATIRPPNHAWEFIAKVGVVSNILDFDGVASDFAKFELVRAVLTGLHVSTDDDQMVMRVYIGGSLTASNYRRCTVLTASDGNETDSSQNSTWFYLNDITATWSTGNASTESFSGIVTVGRPSDAGKYKLMTTDCCHIKPNGAVSSDRSGGFTYNSTAALTGFYVTSGFGLDGGEMLIEGLR